MPRLAPGHYRLGHARRLRTPAVPAPARRQTRAHRGRGRRLRRVRRTALALALRNAGTKVTLASYAVSELGALSLSSWVRTGLAAVRPDSAGNDRYFPERTLARWLAIQGHDPVVYAFERTGVRPLRSAYRKLIDLLGIDAVVLADGGTDILMRGDEAGLGTPEEDMTSLAAVAGLPVPTKLVVSLGFGIDSHHGICHAHVLENLAALQREGRSSARSPSRRAAPRPPPTATPSRTPRPPRRCRPASSTPRSPQRYAATSATCTPCPAPRAPSCSSTR
ncbi:DUF1152 domain-containing protein [Catellatospora coxensis]